MKHKQTKWSNRRRRKSGPPWNRKPRCEKLESRIVLTGPWDGAGANVDSPWSGTSDLMPSAMIVGPQDVSPVAGVDVEAPATIQQMHLGRHAERRVRRNLPLSQRADSWAWFESFTDVPRIAVAKLETVSTGVVDPLVVGPRMAASEWIVQLTDDAVDSLSSLSAAGELLGSAAANFRVIAGLGAPGSLLVRATASDDLDVRAALEASGFVQRFGRNAIVEGQRTPDDPEYEGGLLRGLNQINAATAWNEATGSPSVVVGVVDGGIDVTHPDLFLNVWLNQGEIPPALRAQLTDIDGDGLITFYDLNNLRVTDTSILVGSTGVAASTAEMTTNTPFATGANATLVRDKNANGIIDALDLLDDVNWSDGRDNDGNTFFDDLVGVNFLSGSHDRLPSNRPFDVLGHGTHVAGTIGAVGNNSYGAVGVNWQTSLMSLRILDNNNQSDSAAAIRAINYASQMRADLAVGDHDRVEAGANVRVLNNSWGQPGGYDQALDVAIAEAGTEGILFVAAAGNGNILGNGVDNDTTPFHPASYAAANVIAVGALSGTADGLAPFSNFGADSVDLAAPGVGVRSTLPGGRFGTANGTSMAVPHVAGAAALIWSAFPEATLAEVKQAILGSVEPLPGGSHVLSTAGQLDAGAAIQADVFAPAARLVASENITTAGGTSTEFTVEYSHRRGIDIATIGDDDVLVTRQWGPADQVTPTLKAGSIVQRANTVTATYVMAAPGGHWDPLDFGSYQITTVAGGVAAGGGSQPVEARELGSFRVRIEDPTVLYVDSFADEPGTGSLRDALMTANAAGAPRTIILEAGRYTIDIPHVPDPASTFPTPDPALFCAAPVHTTGWSGETTGDFDVTGSVTIVGDHNDRTVIDGQQFDRVFKVHPGASLDLARVMITGGDSPADQGGGGILSAGTLSMRDSLVQGNTALGQSALEPIRGGGVAAWDGSAEFSRTWITENESNYGGGVFYCDTAGGTISQSTLSHNIGGGLHSASDVDVSVTNSTFSANRGGSGAIFNGKRDYLVDALGAFEDREPSISGDGRFVVFESFAPNLVPGDTNGEKDIFVFDRLTASVERIPGSGGLFVGASISADGRYIVYAGSRYSDYSGGANGGPSGVFVYDRHTQVTQRVDVSATGIPGNRSPQRNSGGLSADGRFVVFASGAENLVPGDTNNETDIFVVDRDSGQIERVSVASDGTQANGESSVSSISADGRFVAFYSLASNLVDGDTNEVEDVFLYDRQTDTIERVNVSSDGTQANQGIGYFSGGQGTSLSADGRFVAFISEADNLVPGDTNGNNDVFAYDRQQRTLERISVSSSGLEADDDSYRPSITADGRFVSFHSYANNLVPSDNNGIDDVFVFDRISRTTQLVSAPLDGGASAIRSANAEISADGSTVVYDTHVPHAYGFSPKQLFAYDRKTGETLPVALPLTDATLEATQVTIAETADTRFSVSGNVHLAEVLLANDEVGIDASTTTQNNVVSSPTLGADLIDSLTQFGESPPVHPLIAGNPAVDAGTLSFAGSIDQRGVVRNVPDIGAFETNAATIAGKIFVDLDEDQFLDPDEPGLPEVEIRVTRLGDNVFERVVTSANDDRVTGGDESGLFEVGETPVERQEEYRFSVNVPPQWRLSEPGISRIPSATLYSPEFALSSNGRFIAFESDANTLAPGDTNETDGTGTDIYVYDRKTDTYELVSVSNSGEQANTSSGRPSISGDGRFVAFSSEASNLVHDLPDNGLGYHDVFLFDRQMRTVERVSVGYEGGESNWYSNFPVLSDNGRYLAFLSGASNLVPNDTNGKSDIFVFDRLAKTTERVSVSSTGDQGDGGVVSDLSISANGRYVSFVSDSTNLVANDTNGHDDVFVYDRETKLTERISVSSIGNQANDRSFGPSISADGRFVTFDSQASNLVPGDTNDRSDVFVYDRESDVIQRVSVRHNATSTIGYDSTISADGRFVLYDSYLSPDGNLKDTLYVYDRVLGKTAVVTGITPEDSELTFLPTTHTLSADGRLIAFGSGASNLVPGDFNERSDIFLVANPLAEGDTSLSVVAGDFINDMNFGLIPDPGAISGTLFEDLIENASFDPGETGLSGWTVFLDANGNRLFDDEEVATTTDSDGRYAFADMPGFRNYTTRVDAPVGWEQVLPNRSSDLAWDIFLPPGGNVSGRDYGFRRVSGTGQSTDSSVSGRVFDDVNGNGVYDPGVDVPQAETVVYLDQENFGVLDINERRVESDEDGNYMLAELGAVIVSVSTILDETLMHSSPLGNDFQLEEVPLFTEIQSFGNPQAVTAADFNLDTFPDVAVALYDGNRISIRLNDGSGGIQPNEINIDLGVGNDGATSLVAGQFNGPDTPLDMAVTNRLGNNVTILTDFNGSGFDSQTEVPVGNEPLDIVALQITGDADHLDLGVVNKADNTIQVLLNDGSGTFVPRPAFSSGGRDPVSLVSGQLLGNDRVDIAVAHASPSIVGSPFGDVTILAGDGAGNFAVAPVRYPVGATPTDLVIANFDNDANGRLDLAVSNFGSNSISVLTGNPNDTFTLQAQVLGTEKGARDMAAADIDNDGDVDLLAGNLTDRNIALFRNVTSAAGTTKFEPLQPVGQQFGQLAQRMPLTVANFDQDTSAPGGTGTLDILAIAIPRATEANPVPTDTLHVFRNTLVDGAHRVALTGLNQVTDLNFIVTPTVLLPSLDQIEDPPPILEDAGEQTLRLTGIAAGRSDGPPMRIEARSSNAQLIPNPSIVLEPAGDSGDLRYTPVPDANGTATITVTLTNAGADGDFETADDNGVLARDFTVSVLPVNDPPVFVPQVVRTDEDTAVQLRLQANDADGDSLSFTLGDDSWLRAAVMIDGDVLTYDPSQAPELQDLVQAEAISEPVIIEVSDGLATAVGYVTVTVDGVLDWHHPIRPLDVNRDGVVAPSDALAIINELNKNGAGLLAGHIGRPSKWYDTNGDNSISPFDVLILFNCLNAGAGTCGEAGGSGEGESNDAVNPWGGGWQPWLDAPPNHDVGRRPLSRSADPDLSEGESATPAAIRVPGRRRDHTPASLIEPRLLALFDESDWDDLMRFIGEV